MAGTTDPMFKKTEFASRALKPAQTASMLLCPEISGHEPREWLADLT
jgi:hypothetical protein